MTRSTRLLAVGVTVLVAALVVLLLSLRSQPEPVVVADAAPDAAASATEEGDEPAAGGTVGALADGEARLPAPLEVPAGHEAVAITSAYDRTVAALPVPGDTVNLYGVFRQGLPGELSPTTTSEDGDGAGSAGRGVVRVLSGVEVIGVSGAEPSAGAGNVTLVLALQPDDAERAIYLAGIEDVWFSLVDADHEAVPGRGADLDTILD